MVLGIAIGICFLTGLLSHYQYQPWSWLPEPASPVWGYRVTQGVHVATGMATIPLLLVKLWSVYPNLFRWPPFRSVKHGGRAAAPSRSWSPRRWCRWSPDSSTPSTGIPSRWFFPPVHRFLGYVVVGSILLHVAVKLPDIVYGLQTKVADGDVLTEIPWNENPDSHSNAGPLPPPVTPALSRRGVLTAAGAGIGVVVVTSVGQTLTPLEPLGLLAIRQPSRARRASRSTAPPSRPRCRRPRSPRTGACRSTGRRPYALSLADLEELAAIRGAVADHLRRGLERRTRTGAVSGCSTSSSAPAATPARRVRFHLARDRAASTTRRSSGRSCERALLATHLNGERLSLDHGYPLRLIAPNRPGVLNTKWLTRIEVR